MITTGDDRRELDRLRRRVVSARRVAGGVQFTVGLVFLFVAQDLESDFQSRGVSLTESLPRAAVAFAAWIAVTLMVSAVSARPRRRIVSRYLAEVVRQEGGLRLETRDFELTPLGRGLGQLSMLLSGLAIFGTLLDVTPVMASIVFLGIAAVLFYAVGINPEGAGLQIERLRLTDLEATPDELRWVRDDGTSEVIAWTQLKSVVKRLTPSGIEVKAQWNGAAPIRHYPVHYRDRASGETVDFITVAEAIGPAGFTVRRPIRWLDLAASIEQRTGAA